MDILFVVSRPLEMNSSASLRNISTINGLVKNNNLTVLSCSLSSEHPSYMDITLDERVNIIKANPGISKALSAKAGKNKFLSKIKVIIYKLWNKSNIYDSWKSLVSSDELLKLNLEQYDLMISSSDPKSSHLAAERLYDKKQIRWIQIWGDPFTGDITSTARNEESKSREEKRFFSKATKVFFLSELTCGQMKRRYPEYADKLFFMPRPYLKKKFYENQVFKGRQLSLSYCGDYNSSVRNLKPFYEAVKTTKDKLVICGCTDIELVGTSNITILPRVSQEKVDELENNSDVLIHLSNLSGTQIPGKIYNYSATNKPILFILDGDSKTIQEVFGKYKRYLFCKNDVDDIIHKLNTIREDLYPEGLMPVDDFYVDNVIERLLN